MKSSDKLSNEIDIKNRACYYFDNIIKIEDFDPDDILIDQKPHGNSLVYNISYFVWFVCLIDSKLLF